MTVSVKPGNIAVAVSQAISALRLAGVGGPFTLLLSADAYTLVSETTEHGYPILPPISRAIRNVEQLFRDDWTTSAELYLPVPAAGSMRPYRPCCSLPGPEVKNRLPTG